MEYYICPLTFPSGKKNSQPITKAYLLDVGLMRLHDTETKNYFGYVQRAFDLIEDYNRIVALTETGYSLIADSLYKFIQLEGCLPEEDEIIDLFKSSADMVNYGHKVNRRFIERARGILLHLIPTPDYKKAMQLLRVEEKFNAENSSKDSLNISFVEITLENHLVMN